MPREKKGVAGQPADRPADGADKCAIHQLPRELEDGTIVYTLTGSSSEDGKVMLLQGVDSDYIL